MKRWQPELRLSRHCFSSLGRYGHYLCGLCRLCAAHFVGPFLKERAVLLQVVAISAMSPSVGNATAL